MLKNILLVVALLYTIALALVSLLNASNLPKIRIDNGDKFAHAIAYSLLCFMWYLVFKTHKLAKALLIAACVSIIYGILLEVLQGTLTEARVPDIYDILANCIGVAFISIILVVRNKTHIKDL